MRRARAFGEASLPIDANRKGTGCPMPFSFSADLGATTTRIDQRGASAVWSDSYSGDSLIIQRIPFRPKKAGGRGARTPRTAGRNPAPCMIRIMRSSRHRPDRRRASTGAEYVEGVFSLLNLSGPAFQGRVRRDLGNCRDQMPALPDHQFNEAPEAILDRQMSGCRRRSLWLHTPTNPSPLNCAGSPFVPAMPDSTSAFTSPNPDIELSVTSSGKLTQRRLSWQGWKTRPWLKRLSGTISNPSMADVGATVFISSLRAIPASLSVSAESGRAATTLGISGPMSSGSSAKSSPSGFLPKTSKATSLWDLPRSPSGFKPWAILQKRDCSRRERLAQATGVAASSSWPTPTASDAGYLPDLMIDGATVQPKTPFDIGPTSCGQYSLSNAARSWTQLWRILRTMGWAPVTMPRSSHQLRVSFKFGKGSSIDGLISNPRFFEHVMGWPIGWTAPEVPVTGFAAWLRRSRGALSELQADG